MAWSLYRNEIWAVTVSLSVRYRAPIRVRERTRAVGWLVRRRGRRIEAAGEIRRAEDGKALASATATFVQVPEPQAREWRERYLGDGNRHAEVAGKG